MRKDKRLRELREELRYWQMRVRMDTKSLARTKAKCKEVGAKYRQRYLVVGQEPAAKQERKVKP